MAKASGGIPLLERVEAVLRNPAVYEIARLIPEPDPARGGRPRHYPSFVWIVYETLLSVYGSARQVEAELSHPVVWSFMRSIVEAMFPDDEAMRLPEEPMRRHHYKYGRNRYLSDPGIQPELMRAHREIAAKQAVEVGLMDQNGAGSWTHPDLNRVLHSDGKVVAALYKGKPGDTKIDKTTGEISNVRAERDAALHYEGTGETAWGTKFVVVAARTLDPHGRMILDVEWVPKPGGETKAAMECFHRLVPLLPGAQAIVYDTALRGVHHQEILHRLGLIPVNRVAAAAVLRGSEGHRKRVPKSVHVEDKQIALPGGSTKSVRLYARGGAIGLGELNDRGDLTFIELRRIKTHRSPDKAGQFRWYNEYRLPESYGDATVVVRLDTTDVDRSRGFNRSENVRVIAQTDRDFPALFGRRNDAESINRGLDDSLYLGRAHSLGHARQLTNLLGFALMINSLALHRHRRRLEAQPTAA